MNDLAVALAVPFVTMLLVLGAAAAFSGAPPGGTPRAGVRRRLRIWGSTAFFTFWAVAMLGLFTGDATRGLELHIALVGGGAWLLGKLK
jgi:hypothetical protein